MELGLSTLLKHACRYDVRFAECLRGFRTLGDCDALYVTWFRRIIILVGCTQSNNWCQRNSVTVYADVQNSSYIVAFIWTPAAGNQAQVEEVMLLPLLVCLWAAQLGNFLTNFDEFFQGLGWVTIRFRCWSGQGVDLSWNLGSGQAIKLFQITPYVSDFQTFNNPGRDSL